MVNISSINNKANVFILTDSLNSFQGGAERQILELVKSLNKNKFRIFVGCLSCRDDALKDMEKFGASVIEFKIKRIYDIRGIKQGFRFIKLLKREQINVLLTYHFGSDIWGTIFGKMAGVSRIISNRRDEGFWRKQYHVVAYRCINRWVSKIIVVSKAIKDVVIRDEKMPSDKIEVIYNGINLERFSNGNSGKLIMQELKFTQNERIIGCVGNLKSVKGHKFLIDAAKNVINKISNVHFVIIGMGELKDELDLQISQLGLNENFHLLGRRTDVPTLLAGMDICVLPSLSEGLSNTLLEYMASGKPIIATNVGGNPEVISDRLNGILVKKESSKDLTDQLLYLLNNQSECQRLSINAKEDVKKQFNIQKMIEKYEYLLNGERG